MKTKRAKMKKKINTAAKAAKTAGKKGAVKVQQFLNSKEGKALVQGIIVILPVILNALPATRKVKIVRGLISKIF